ncbi:DUF6894 family protein [uncultured Methylobacterium sp.]|uniref:DUF6894 family protein n=1 Tax=uncultured Methylobacterium sp. TaxID=157278 RepID=UPI0035CC641D
MPRYFFNTQIGAERIADPDGTDLPDADHAWETARDTIRAALRETNDQARLMAASLLVTDATGDVVLEFPFAEAVPLSGGRDGLVP